MPVHKIYPDQYETQLQQKVALTEREFAPFAAPELEVFASPPEGFRMRAEFRLWHADNRVDYAMFEPGRAKRPFVITNYPAGSPTINLLMPKVLHALNKVQVLRERVFQVDFLTARTGEAVVTLIYHRKLDAEWQQAAQKLSEDLGCSIIGRSRKQKLVVGVDYVREQFEVHDRQFRYRQYEGAFSQPNGEVCEKMLNWAVSVVGSSQRDLLELYCGNGNFTLPLASRHRQVLATEISKAAVDSAHTNLNDNGIDNVEIARMSSEEFTQAYDRVRAFNRLKHIDLDEYDFGTIFVDPPRAGLDSGTLALAQRFDRILYISCNPSTLKDNLMQLHESYRVARMALFDQFPYTEHRECGVLLERR